MFKFWNTLFEGLFFTIIIAGKDADQLNISWVQWTFKAAATQIIVAGAQRDTVEPANIIQHREQIKALWVPFLCPILCDVILEQDIPNKVSIT